MFKKLRRRLTLAFFAISLGLLLLADSVIVLAVSQSANLRGPVAGNTTMDLRPEVENIVVERVEKERLASKKSLILTLSVTTVALETAVMIVAKIVIDKTIKPVQDAYESQRQFISNASHEIKTPLAAIQANLEAAAITDNHWIDNVSYETEKLSDLTRKLLTLTRSDARTTPGKTEPLNLGHLIKKLVTPLEPRLTQKSLTIDLVQNQSGDRPIKITANRSDLEQLLNILLDNAIKYGKSQITLEYSERSLKISNDGATIPAAKIPHIFDRFYQTDKTSDGVGLGLAIAASIAARNHWTLKLTSGAPATFVLNFK